MASVNKNENLDDCIRNVNNEAFRHLVQGGNLNTLQEAQQTKQIVAMSQKNRKYSVDSWMLKHGLIKGPASRRASCSPSMILPRIPSASTSHSGTSKGRRRHSHAGILSASSVLNFGTGNKLSSKCRRKSMVSLVGDSPTTSCSTLGPMDLRSMFDSQAALQELDERRDSSHETTVLAPLETEISLEGDNEKLYDALKTKISVQDIPEQSVNCESSDLKNSLKALPKSASFMSLDQAEMETQSKINRSASFSLPLANRQRKTAVSYSCDNYPIIECSTVLAEDHLGPNQEDSQFPGRDHGENISCSDSSSSSILSLLSDDELHEDPMNLFLLDASFHLTLLHPAPQLSCCSALRVWILLTLIIKEFQ